jgi:hypothetical protein
MSKGYSLITSIILILSSLFLLKSNEMKEIILSMLLIVFSYLILHKKIIKKTVSNPKIGFIFSFGYVLSYLLIIWINLVSVKLGSHETPFLASGDSLGYFNLAIELLKSDVNSILQSINYIGYVVVLSWIFKLFGPYVIYGLIINMILLYVNIYLISECVVKITKRQNDFQSSFIILLLTSSFMCTGFMLLKDIFITTSITFSLYASINLLENKKLTKSYILLIISVIIMSSFRFTFIWLIPFVFLLVNFRKNKTINVFLILFLIFIASQVGGAYTSLLSFSNTIDFLNSNDVISNKLVTDGSSTVSGFLLGYNDWVFLKKIIFLPITSAFQYILPFDFYNFDNLFENPYILISKNYNFLWLIYIGPLLLFSIFNMFKLKLMSIKLIRNISVLGIFLFFIPAFMFGGLIPRYAVPFFSLLLPMMAINYTEIKLSKTYRKKWKNFRAKYLIVSVFLLITFLISKAF